MRCLSELAEMGDAEAVIKFYQILSICSHEFLEYAKSYPKYFETFMPLAKKTTAWPSIISMHKGIEEINRKLISDLHLGEDVKLNLNCHWNLDAPEFKAALWLIQLMETYRESQSPAAIKRQRKLIKDAYRTIGQPKNSNPKKIKFDPPKFPTTSELEKEFALKRESIKLSKNLPPFDKDSYKQWFDASMPLFLSRWREDFENRKWFARFVPIAQKIADKENKKVTGVLRRYIKNRILAAFRQLAPEVDLKTKS